MRSAAEARLIRRLYWTSFALRFAVGMAAWALTVYSDMPFMEDARTYSANAATTAHAWLTGGETTWLNQAVENGRQPWLMVGTLAVFYCLTGGTEVLPLALACYCLLTSWTPVLAYRAGLRLGAPPRGALSGARLVAFTPAFAFWSSALYKEGLILMALFLVVEHGLRLQEAVRPSSVLVLVACLLALFGLRFYIGTIVSVTLFVGLALGRVKGRVGEGGVPPILRQAVVLIALGGLFLVSGVAGRMEAMVSDKLETNLEQINTSRRDLASYRSGYLQSVDVSSPAKAVAFLPVGVAYFLTVPLPWHIGAMRQNLAIPETLFWIAVVYPRAARGLWRGAHANPPGTLFLLLATAGMAALYGLFIGNIGTAYRVRVQVWAIVALFAGWGWRPLPPARVPSPAPVPAPGRRRPRRAPAPA